MVVLTSMTSFHASFAVHVMFAFIWNSTSLFATMPHIMHAGHFPLQSF
jgi:hypothetical protein